MFYRYPLLLRPYGEGYFLALFQIWAGEDAPRLLSGFRGWRQPLISPGGILEHPKCFLELISSELCIGVELDKGSRNGDARGRRERAFLILTHYREHRFV